MKRLRIFFTRVGFWEYPNASPPLGIMYLAGYLRSKFDADIRLICQRVDHYSHDRLVQAIAEFGADIVGFSSTTPAAHNLPHLTQQVRNALPKALILLGGAHVAASGATVLEDTAADVAIPGEGERATEAVIHAWFGDGALADIPGIFWRDRDGGAVSNPGTVPLIEDLDSMPMPAYDLIDLPAYWQRQSFPSIPRRRYVSLFSSRGCPYRCFYCHHVFGKQFRGHSAERMVEEIEYYQRRYGVNDFEFLDDIFNLDHKRLAAFCDLVRQRGLKLRLVIPNGVRTDILTEEEIEALAEIGTYYISFALESGSPRIQKLIRKSLNISQFLQNVERAANRRIFCNGYAIVGFPTETEAEIQQTIDVACQSQLHIARFFMATPFPGTELYDLAMQTCPERLARIHYNDMEYEFVPVNLTDVPDEVFFRYTQKAYHKFYMNPRRVWRVLRDFPQRHLIPLYVPSFMRRFLSGFVRPPELPR